MTGDDPEELAMRLPAAMRNRIVAAALRGGLAKRAYARGEEVAAGEYGSAAVALMDARDAALNWLAANPPSVPSSNHQPDTIVDGQGQTRAEGMIKTDSD